MTVVKWTVVGTVCLIVAAFAGAQSTTSGSVQGSVKDADGGALPGVTVVARSEALVGGRAQAVTDQRGTYRFPSLAPGVYAFEAELSGFRPARRDAVRVNLGLALAVDFKLELSGAREEVTVTGDAPVVSVVDNAVSNNLTTDYLERQPLPRDVNAFVNYVPGVNAGHAYGGTEERTIAFNLDGVNVSNPASGEHWALTNPDWLQEVQVVGLGAPAEFGGFTGAVFNLVTKSGGNSLKGDASLYYSGGSLVAKNAPAGSEGTALLPSEKNSDWDASVSLGGPAARDRLWYFVSAQKVRTDIMPFYRGSAPASEKLNTDDRKSRYMGKMTAQFTPASKAVAMLFYDDRYTDRRGAGGTLLASAARRQESPNWEYNGTFESLVNDRNFVSVKLTGFTGRDDRLPSDGNQPGRNDDTTGFGWDNAAFTLRQKIERATVDGTWSLFADGLLGSADSHTFKFGANWEWGHYDQQQPRNGGFSYYDRSSRCPSLDAYFANPACAAYSSDRGNEIFLNAVQTGLNLFAQDSLRLKRVTINAGLRYTSYRAGFKGKNESVYTADMLAPRLGLVWDVFGDARTAVKVHWGRYYLGMFSYLYDREASGGAFTPAEIWDYNSKTGQYDIFVSRTSLSARLDGNIKHPSTDQVLLSVEQQLGRTMSVGIDLAHRDDNDTIAMVNSNDNYTQWLASGNPLGNGVPIFNLQTDPVFVITNPAAAYRRYNAATLRFEKRYADGWLLRASLVWADLKGNALKNNSYVPEFQDRNGQVNADGKLPSFSQWEFKLSGSVDLWWGVQAAAYYTYLSGEYWTPYVRVTGLVKNSSTNVNIRPRGSEQLRDRNLVDLRLSKTVDLPGAMRLAVFADAFNVLNANTVTSVDQRWGTYAYNKTDPNKSTWSSRTAYGAPLAMESPREIRLGLRLSF